MAQLSSPLTALSEAQRTQAVERFALLRLALEGGISQVQIARTHQLSPPHCTELNEALPRAGFGWPGKLSTLEQGKVSQPST